MHCKHQDEKPAWKYDEYKASIGEGAEVGTQLTIKPKPLEAIDKDKANTVRVDIERIQLRWHQYLQRTPRRKDLVLTRLAKRRTHITHMPRSTQAR